MELFYWSVYKVTAWRTSVNNLYKWHAGHAKLCGNVCLLLCTSYSSSHLLLYFEFPSCRLFIKLMLHKYFWRTVVLGGLWRRLEPTEWAEWKVLRGLRTGFSCNLSCIPDMASIDLCKKLATIFEEGWTCHWCTLSKLLQNVVWNHCNLSFRSSSDVHTTGGSRHCHWHIMFTVRVVWLLVLHSSPTDFWGKTDCLRSVAFNAWPEFY